MTASGQSLAEFALVIPVLLIILLGVADLGRVFYMNITLESATRDAAEVSANSYLASPPAPLSDPAPSPLSGYYETIHLSAARAVCASARSLPGVTFDPLTASCPGMPLAFACVHDGQDPLCSAEVNGAPIPAGCDSLSTPPTNAQADGTRRYVEIRTCYRFDPILQLPLFSTPTIWLQRSRSFEIPCYFLLGPSPCG